MGNSIVNLGVGSPTAMGDESTMDYVTGILSDTEGNPVDNLRYASPKEFEEGTYRHLQNLQQRMSEHLSASQNPVTTQAGVPMQANPETMRYHQEQAEELRAEIDDFSGRRAEAILSYPDRFNSDHSAANAPVFINPTHFGDEFTIRNFDDGGAEGIMSVDLSKGADTTGPDTMQPIPQYPGIEGFDIYKDLAPEQFKRRPVAKQNFDKKRGFQFGQMVELRDDAVGGKLLKQAGIMTPVDQVKQTVDPKVMDQMSRILGREVV